VQVIAARLALLGLVLAAWQLLPSRGLVNPLLLPPLGFRIATFLFVLSLQVTLEWPRGRKHWLLAIAVAAATSLICYLVFQNYLSLLLPRGTWSNV